MVEKIEHKLVRKIVSVQWDSIHFCSFKISSLKKKPSFGGLRLFPSKSGARGSIKKSLKDLLQPNPTQGQNYWKSILLAPHFRVEPVERRNLDAPHHHSFPQFPVKNKL